MAALLIGGLLALAEGRSDDRSMLGEAADREDVLNEISPDILDKIAYRLYAEDEKNLSAYERLLKDDKRKKMDYLNTIRPEFAYNTEDDKNRDQSNELELSTAE